MAEVKKIATRDAYGKALVELGRDHDDHDEHEHGHEILQRKPGCNRNSFFHSQSPHAPRAFFSA